MHDDAAWFAGHPAAAERVRPFSVAEQLGYWLTAGQVRGKTARIVRTRRWFTRDGVRTHEMLSVYEAD